MKYLLALTLFAAPGLVFAGEWELKSSTDAMTDQTSSQAEVRSADGDTFTVLRRSDGSVWGYVRLAGTNQFGINENLMIRVDKNKPIEFNDKLATLSRQLGISNPIQMWEWNPSLIGFRMWHGNPAEGCGIIQQLYNGHQIIVRYHPSQSTYRDITFTLSGNAKAITDALGFNINDCKP